MRGTGGALRGTGRARGVSEGSPGSPRGLARGKARPGPGGARCCTAPAALLVVGGWVGGPRCDPRGGDGLRGMGRSGVKGWNRLQSAGCAAGLVALEPGSMYVKQTTVLCTFADGTDGKGTIVYFALLLKFFFFSF